MFVGDIAEREAGRNPDRTAMIEAGSDRQITYGELALRVEALAGAFVHTAQLAKGERIMMLCLNRIECVEIYLAAARSGMIAVSLNWRLAIDEMEEIVKDCGARVLVCEAGFASIASELARRCDLSMMLVFGDDSDGSYEDFVGKGSGRQITLQNAYTDPAMILYTGGTTGKSKGVVHSLGSILGAMMSNTVAERIIPEDRYLFLGSMFHSAAILGLNYLLNGATLVMLPKFEPRLALDAIEAHRITKSMAFPAMVNYLLAEAGSSRFDLSSLRNLQYGGGPFGERIIREMAEALPCGLLQCYGSTEHVGVSFLSPDDHREALSGRHPHRLQSAGRAAHVSLIRILDSQGQPVPRDRKTPGEIFVRSASNMTGYWNRPDLTDALRGPQGELGSGDIAVWDEDGYIYVVDRAKEMIISGGENIYPAQVEKAIFDHPGVLEAAVVGAGDEVWGESVVAFVVPRKGFELSGDDVRRTVTGKLGSYQKPRVVHFLPELPRSASGKIAKSELRRIAALHDESEN